MCDSLPVTARPETAMPVTALLQGERSELQHAHVTVSIA
jgi:hypothetical protein